MAVRYVGGKPSRITCYTERKNTDRWMHVPKEKIHLPNGELIFYTIVGIAAIGVLAWFVAMCLK